MGVGEVAETGLQTTELPSQVQDIALPHTSKHFYAVSHQQHSIKKTQTFIVSLWEVISSPLSQYGKVIKVEQIRFLAQCKKGKNLLKQ